MSCFFTNETKERPPSACRATYTRAVVAKKHPQLFPTSVMAAGRASITPATRPLVVGLDLHDVHD